MSDQSVLYDVPGPRAVRRHRIGTVVALLFIAGLVAVAWPCVNELPCAPPISLPAAYFMLAILLAILLLPTFDMLLLLPIMPLMPP